MSSTTNRGRFASATTPPHSRGCCASWPCMSCRSLSRFATCPSRGAQPSSAAPERRSGEGGLEAHLAVGAGARLGALDELEALLLGLDFELHGGGHLVGAHPLELLVGHLSVGGLLHQIPVEGPGGV